MTDRANRALLGLVALLLTAVGILGVLANRGLIAMHEPAALYGDLTQFVLRRASVVWPVVILVALLLGLAGLALLRGQLPRVPGHLGVRDATLAETDRGRTTLAPATAATAVGTDLERIPGVANAHVRVRSIRPRLQLHVRLELTDGASTAHVREGAEHSYGRLASAIGGDELDVETNLRLDSARRGRVV